MSMDEERVAANAAAAPAENRGRVEREVQEFVQAFPGVTKVPQEVWNGVRDGKTLTGAYQDWQGKRLQEENRHLREALKAKEKNAANREKSVGSQRSEGAGGRRDAFVNALLGD